MARLVGLVLGIMFVADAAFAAPVAESPSPLIPMVWTQETTWTLAAAIPSPDCDFAVEVRGPVTGSTQEVKWAHLDGTGEDWRTTLQFGAGDASDFYYSQTDGFLPLAYQRQPNYYGSTSAWMTRDKSHPGRSTVVAPLSSTGQGYWIFGLDTIPRAGRTPYFVITEWVSYEFPITPLVKSAHYFRVMGPNGGEEGGVPPGASLAFHATDGSPLFAVVTGGRLGATDATGTMTDGPTVPFPSGSILYAMAQSTTGLGALIGTTANDLNLVTWDESTSRSLTLTSDVNAYSKSIGSRGVAQLEALDRGRWLATYNASMRFNAWMIDGSVVKVGTHTNAYSYDHTNDYAVDLSDPREPLFAFESQEVRGNFFNNHKECTSLIRSLAWREDLGDWEYVPLARYFTDDTVWMVPLRSLSRVAVGRDAKGVPTVCFREGPFEDVATDQTKVYRVAIPRIIPPPPPDGWLVY